MPRPLTLRDLRDVNGQTERQQEECADQERPAPSPCTAKVGGVPISPKGAEWPSILEAVIAWCQRPGQSIRSGQRLTADAVCTLVGAFIWPEGDDTVSAIVQRTIRDLWDAANPDWDLGGMLGAWNTFAANALAKDREQALNVLAVRAVLKAIADQAVTYDRAQHKSDSRGVSF